MPATVRVLREAAEEARAAWRWYRRRDPDVAEAFLSEYDRALEQIADGPERWAPYLEGARRLVMHRFPYSIVYRVKSAVIEVVAVAHQHRRPGYWRERTG